MRYFLLFLLILFYQPFAAAQEQSEDVICLSFKSIWDGSSVETANIQTQPIPETYKQGFNATGCSSSQFARGSLLDWHRRFGDHATMETAADYITAPIRKALENGEIEKGHHLISAHTSLAHYYYDGARAFGSETLIKKALKHAEMAQSATKVEVVGQTNGYSYNQYSDLGISWQQGDNSEYLSRLTTNIAARKASITEKKSDIDNASKYYDTPQAVVFEKAIDVMVSDERTLCEGDWEDETFDDLCDDLSGDYTQLIDYKLGRALLVASTVDTGKSKFEPYQAVKLMQIAEVAYQDVDISVRNSIERARFDLHLAYSQAYLKKALSGEPSDSVKWLDSCLEESKLSARYAPKYLMPSQWDRAANQYLRCARPLKKLIIDSENYYYSERDLDLGIAYFEDL